MMNSFYSIIYIEPEPVTEEKISVGLFLNADKKPIFDYSENKLKVASKIVGSEIIDSLERILRNIKKKTASFSEDEKQAEAFEVKPFSESYFKYLNNYSNNLITYSDPSKNHGDFSLSDYKELFRLLVDKKYGIEEEEKGSFKTSVKKKIKSSVVKEKVDVFYKVPKESVETIYQDHIVDYIGVNGSIISGNSIDMKGNLYTLENKFYLLKFLAAGLSRLSVKLDLKGAGKHVVFYNEPEEDKNKDLLHRALNDGSSPLTLKHWENFEEEEDWIARNTVLKNLVKSLIKLSEKVPHSHPHTVPRGVGVTYNRNLQNRIGTMCCQKTCQVFGNPTGLYIRMAEDLAAQYQATDCG